jgi:hypothetical protein
LPDLLVVECIKQTAQKQPKTVKGWWISWGSRVIEGLAIASRQIIYRIWASRKVEIFISTLSPLKIGGNGIRMKCNGGESGKVADCNFL